MWVLNGEHIKDMISFFPFVSLGKNPWKTNLSLFIPLADKALIEADIPPIGTTFMFFSLSAFIRI